MPWTSGKHIRAMNTLLKPHFYIVKVGYAEVHLFFLFLLHNIDCVYSLELPRIGRSNVYPQSMFWSKNKKNIKIFLLKIFNFYNLGKMCILQGLIFVMTYKPHCETDFFLSIFSGFLTRPPGYKTVNLFMLNSTETKIYPAHKC